jgi:hypothetical protein
VLIEAPTVMARNPDNPDQSPPAGRGQHLLSALTGEILRLLPAMVFFLIGFNLIALSKHAILANHGIAYEGLAKATIGALLVAKVVALAGLLPIMKRLQQRSLWSPALLQAAVYTILCMAVHEIEGLVRLSVSAASLVAGVDLWRDEFKLAEFLFIAIWVFALFAVFVAFAELIARSEFKTWRTALLTGRVID